MGVMTYSQAGCLALRQEMEANDKVWALGEDVGLRVASLASIWDCKRFLAKNLLSIRPFLNR